MLLAKRTHKLSQIIIGYHSIKHCFAIYAVMLYICRNDLFYNKAFSQVK